MQELQAAEDAGQRAWIIAHMPPSGGDAMHDQVGHALSFGLAALLNIGRKQVQLLQSDYSTLQGHDCGSILWTFPHCKVLRI